jgi:hypothetical protein
MLLFAQIFVNISIFYALLLCHNDPSYHKLYTFINYAKTFENQTFNSPSQAYYMKLSIPYNKLFSSNEGFSISPKHPFMY